VRERLTTGGRERRAETEAAYSRDEQSSVTKRRFSSPGAQHPLRASVRMTNADGKTRHCGVRVLRQQSK